MQNPKTSPALDHPHVRAGHICPLCGGQKDAALLTCWRCFRTYDMRNGGDDVMPDIDAAEAELVAVANTRRIAL